MKLGLSTFVPERLTQARLARGIMKKDLAEKLGVSGQALRSYETGDARPLPDRVERMSETLDFPVSFFTTPTQKSPDVQVFWRNQKKDTKSSREQTRQRIGWACEIFAILEDYVQFPDLSLPKLELPEDWKNIDTEDLERAAEACRDQWGLGDYPIPDMTLALENIGIPVIALPIDTARQSGFSHFDADFTGRRIAGHNVRRTSAARSRFNLAHELAHLLLHESVSKRDQATHFDLIESQAHRFASALLFPRTAFFREVRYASLEAFTALKRDWNISIMAQIKRAYDLNLIDADRQRSLFISAGRKGYKKALGEPFDKETPIEKPRMLRRAIDAIEAASTLQLKVIDQRLPLPEAEFEAIVGRKLKPANSNVVPLRSV